MRLISISLIISVLGIFLLLAISVYQSPKEVTSYKQLSLGDYVKITGKISSIRSYGDFSIITLENKVQVLCNKCNFKQNQTITATGKVTEYQNKLQISAYLIK